MPIKDKSPRRVTRGAGSAAVKPSKSKPVSYSDYATSLKYLKGDGVLAGRKKEMADAKGKPASRTKPVRETR